MSGDERIGFEYALLRVVPRVERGEAVNVGVIVYAQTGDHLSVATHVAPDRLRALDADLDVRAVEESLAALTAVCEGRADAGPAGSMPVGQRFRWLVAPRSTVVQPGPVHTGRTATIDAEAQRLLARLVLPPL